MNDNHDTDYMNDTERGQGDHSYPPTTAAQQDKGQQDKGQPGESSYSDGSDALFSMYLRRTREEDDRMAESWKGYADGMLTFTGLFSAAVAALLAVTVQDIRPSSQDNTAFYLARINQQLSSQLNEPQDPIPTRLSNPAQPFSAPTSAVWVNGLWFLSLVISLTCALMSTLLQQWARRYLEVAYPRLSPPKRARVRTFYSEGVEELHVPWTVEALPALLHSSLFLFFAGLAVFLFNVHLTIFGVVIAWIGICVILYACITFLPIIRKNSPYSGPLSALFSLGVTGMRHAFEKFRRKFGSARRPVHFFSRSMRETAKEYALKLHRDIDFRALLWTFESLDEDGELHEFFEGLLGLCSSKSVQNALQDFIEPRQKMLAAELMELMNRTLSSNLVSEPVKQSRITICTKLIETTHLVGDWTFLRRVFLGDWHQFLRCVEFGIFAQKKVKSIRDGVTALFAQCSAAVVISNVRERDENWYELVFGQLTSNNTPKPLLHRYLSHGDSILLANHMFIVRRIVQTYSGLNTSQKEDLLRATSKTLKSVCKFNVKRNIVPQLQHEFCNLWNQLVDKAENDGRSDVKCITKTVVEHTRKLYDALHQGTDDAVPFPKCNRPEHRPIHASIKSQWRMSPTSSSDIVLTSPVEELQFDEPPLAPSSSPLTRVIPASPGLPPESAMPAFSSVASLLSHTSAPASSSPSHP